MLVRYEDLRYRTDLDWAKSLDKPVARYPTGRIGKVTLREFMKAESELLLWYDAAGRSFTESGLLPPSFVSLYKNLTHPVFLEYLNRFAPQFMKVML